VSTACWYLDRPVRSYAVPITSMLLRIELFEPHAHLLSAGA
jgi:hypothetical protein